MLASAVNRALKPVSLPITKTRLLLVSDSPDRLRALQTGLNYGEFDITRVSSVEELTVACHDYHDVVALDVSPTQVAPMLRLIRASAPHTKVPVLVEASQIKNDLTLAGILPRYRAMPCSYTEMVTLVKGRSAPVGDSLAQRGML